MWGGRPARVLCAMGTARQQAAAAARTGLCGEGCTSCPSLFDSLPAVAGPASETLAALVAEEEEAAGEAAPRLAALQRLAALAAGGTQA